jgi:hypothetical protein
MIRALYFCCRWALATALLNTSAGFARLVRKVAPSGRQGVTPNEQMTRHGDR